MMSKRALARRSISGRAFSGSRSKRAGRRTYSPSALTRTIAGTNGFPQRLQIFRGGFGGGRTSSALRRTAFSSGESCPASSPSAR
jgi:hypothetical protein